MAAHRGKYVSYIRVSTKKQQQSGLGLKAQRAAVEAWLNGGSWELVKEIVEIESGKSDRNRPELQHALDTCRRYRAKLIISRLDRLSRDPVFLLAPGGVRIPASDICRHLSDFGLTLIVGRIEDDWLLARILGFGVLLGNGTLFGAPKLVKPEIVSDRGAAAA